MSRLCLSATLLVLLVILVDGTPKNIDGSRVHSVEIKLGREPTQQVHKKILSKLIDSLRKGVELSYGTAPERPSHNGIFSSIFNGLLKGIEDIEGLGSGLLQGLKKTISNIGLEVLAQQLQKRSVKELPTQMLRHETSKPSICLEPALRGPCSDQEMKYFYNAKTGHCEIFMYGGCKGNNNNFSTERDCKKMCGEKRDPSDDW